MGNGLNNAGEWSVKRLYGYDLIGKVKANHRVMVGERAIHRKYDDIRHRSDSRRAIVGRCSTPTVPQSLCRFSAENRCRPDDDYAWKSASGWHNPDVGVLPGKSSGYGWKESDPSEILRHSASARFTSGNRWPMFHPDHSPIADVDFPQGTDAVPTTIMPGNRHRDDIIPTSTCYLGYYDGLMLQFEVQSIK